VPNDCTGLFLTHDPSHHGGLHCGAQADAVAFIWPWQVSATQEKRATVNECWLWRFCLEMTHGHFPATSPWSKQHAEPLLSSLGIWEAGRGHLEAQCTLPHDWDFYLW
jgi:hypothetical protein